MLFLYSEFTKKLTIVSFYFLIQRASFYMAASMAEWLRAWAVGYLDHDEAMEAGGREFDPRPGHYSRMSFLSNQATGTVFSSECAFLSKF